MRLREFSMFEAYVLAMTTRRSGCAPSKAYEAIAELRYPLYCPDQRVPVTLLLRRFLNEGLVHKGSSKTIMTVKEEFT